MTSYYLSDGQGSTRALLNGTGDLTDTYNYTAYGEMYNQTGSTLNNYLYTGQQFDSLKGLYSLRARYYDPSVGRFVSRDTYPINYRNPIELNRYGYTANNPVNRSDPTGRFMEYAFLHADKEVVGGTIGGAAGGFAFSTFLYILGILNPLHHVCGAEGQSELNKWALHLTIEGKVLDFIGQTTAQGAVYGAIGGVIAAIDPIIAGLMLTMGVAEAINWLFSTYTEPGDQICAGAAGVVGAVTAIAASWTATTGWDNWSNGRGRPGLGGEGPDGRPSNSGSGYEPGSGGPPDDGSGGPYDPPSGTPGDEGNPEWPTSGGLDDSDQYPTSGGLDDSDQYPTGAGDDDGRPGLGGLGEHFCSFSEDTPVATEDGETPIGDLELGDKVLAYNEETGELEYQEVTAVWEHYDNVLLLTIDGEALETTTDHPFYTDEGEWIAAGDLEIGVSIRKADGTYGEVETIEQTETTQPMFNLTVDEVHTYFVGDGQWLVHNECYPTNEIRYTQNTASPRGSNYTVDENTQWLIDHPGEELNAPAIRIFRKTPEMDLWSPVENRGSFPPGDARNLVDGEMYSIDNRRLAAYRAAGREYIPVEILDVNNTDDLRVITSNINHFTTTNGGTSILIDGEIY